MNTLALAQIGGVNIRQTEDGLFCINDLHKSAGGYQRHKPNCWLALRQTTDLIEALESERILESYDAGIPASKSRTVIKIVKGKGLDQGTYVVMELVYVYAMWISPTFFLKVIRTFDSVVTKSQNFASLEMHELRKEIARLSKAIENSNPQKTASSKRSARVQNTQKITRLNTQIITRSEPYARGREKIQIVADAVQFEDFFVFGAVMDFANQIVDINSKHLSTILVDLGFEPRTRRRINGERQSIWARKGFKASDQWLADNVTPSINTLII